MSPAAGYSEQPLHIIFDDSALVAAGRSNVLASTLIARAHPDPFQDRDPDEAFVRIHTTACALVAADRERPGTGMHAAALPNLDVVPLDLPAALEIMASTDWAMPHTRHAAEPSLERPDGAIVATTRPELWQGQPVRILNLNP